MEHRHAEEFFLFLRQSCICQGLLNQNFIWWNGSFLIFGEYHGNDHRDASDCEDRGGLGGDFDGISSVIAGLEDVSTYPALTAELLRRGYKDDDIKKILGLNVLRVMRQVEKVAAGLQKTRQPSTATIEQLEWTVNATGGDCTTSASGSVPIRLGADGNPWGSIWIEPDTSGELTYSVQIGPWPDAYVPRFTYRCRREIPELAGIMYSGYSWWVHPEGVKVSDEGKARFAHIGRDDRVPSATRGTIKDSLANTHPMEGTIKWVWDFRLVR